MSALHLDRWSTVPFAILSAVLLATAAPVSGAPGVARRAVTADAVRAEYHGPAAIVDALEAGDAQPRALARADFDRDGAADLVAGYASNGAGSVTLQRGNPD